MLIKLYICNRMTRISQIPKYFLLRKLATAVLITASVAAFATLGDDKKQKNKTAASTLLPYSAKNFSLKSNYNYQSNNLFNKPERKNFILLNRVVTYEKSNAAFVLPLKKLPLMGKIKFGSAPQRF